MFSDGKKNPFLDVIRDFFDLLIVLVSHAAAF
jgi:hypothetical protein